MSVFATKSTRDLRGALNRLDRHESEIRTVAGDVDEIAKTLADLRKRIEALEAERERTAPCPK